jgi:hypothetical protein
MGISSWVFKNLKLAYQDCMTKTIPLEFRQGRHMAVADEQGLIKVHNAFVNTLHKLLEHIVGSVVAQMRRTDIPCPSFISLFDRWTPDAKAIKTHSQRDKGIEPLVYDPQNPILDPTRPHEVLDILHPDNWPRYTTNRELVRRELYPLIWNAFIDEKYYTPLPGEQLILHGLPGQWRTVRNPHFMAAEAPTSTAREIDVMCPRDRITPLHEKLDPDLYNRVFLIQYGGIKTEWKAALNEIGEADLAIVKYWQFFPQDNWVIFMDDGDALPISLLHAFDRFQPDGTLGERSFYICKPRKGASGKELRRRARERKLAEGKKLTEDEVRDQEKLEAIELARGKSWSRIEAERPKEYYINVNGLFRAIVSDPRLAKVQNPVLYVVMGIVLSGTDYFGGGANGASCLPGIGQQSVIWPALFQHASEFSHMIQASMAHPPDPDAWREVVIDREAVISFFNACYLQKYEGGTLEELRTKFQQREAKRLEGLSKKLAKIRKLPTTTPADVAKVQASMAKPREQNAILSEDDMHVLVSHLHHNIMYWRNAWKRNYERYPDIFERDEAGTSVWGYDHTTRTVAERVSRQMPFSVDEVYRRWFVAERRREPRQIGTAPSVDAPVRKFP